jgi:hypothetical protein
MSFAGRVSRLIVQGKTSRMGLISRAPCIDRYRKIIVPNVYKHMSVLNLCPSCMLLTVQQQYIIDQCLAKGSSSGIVAFGDGGYKYEMIVDPSSGTTPAQDVQCSSESNTQPQPFDNDLLWFMRQAYCGAGGCSDKGDECEVYVHGNGYRMQLTGSVPSDQTATQNSEVCFDATVGLTISPLAKTKGC